MFSVNQQIAFGEKCSDFSIIHRFDASWTIKIETWITCRYVFNNLLFYYDIMILICTSFYLCSTNSYFCLSKGLSNAFSWSMSKWYVSERMYWCILVMISQPSLRYVLFRFIKICTVRTRNTRTKHNVCLQQDRITLEWIWFYHITSKVNWKWGRGG